jgi:BirA family biotin operon repressor/biotin-[acetyl-CoA-carboxylase] ligase
VPRLDAYRVTGSTNDRAAELVASGCEPWTVVVADEQTAGRGRRGSQWWSPPGVGLWMSIVLPSLPEGAQAHLPLLVGLATAEAIEACTTGVAVGIKWPNDLWVGERKLGGVLCETSGRAVVAGIGVNIGPPPGGFPGALAGVATALEMEAGKSMRRSRLALSIVHAVEGRLAQPRDGFDPGALAELRGRDALLGRALEWGSGRRGTGAGLDADGALLVTGPDGSVARVVAGSVRLR